MEQLELRVNGMSCSACERRIEKALSQLDGVVRSTADHRARTVRVVFDSAQASAEAVTARIEQAGYEVV
jgi:copper chaperone CopZ